MAGANLLEPVLREMGREMAIDAIPEKLRCSTCDKLATNGFKLACCDNAICDECREQRQEEQCPVCMHSPFNFNTSIVAKQLRTTVKVFLRTEAKKRGIDPKTGEKIIVEAPVVDSVESTDSPAPATATNEKSTEGEQASHLADGVAIVSETPDVTQVAAAGEPATPNGEPALGESAESKPSEKEQDEEEEEDDDDDDDVIITTERPDPMQQQEEGDYHQQSVGQAEQGSQNADQSMSTDQQQDFGYGNANMNMNMNNMGMNGFNPMMMQGMMGPNMMMGMPPMGMDPSMMFNGNFGAMGGMDMMSMMNMMGGGFGGIGNGMAGDFNAMGGPGFSQNQGNYQMQYNQGNARHQNSFYNDRGYGRGYGRGGGFRGRGNFRGRGGWAYQQNHQYGPNQQYGSNQQFGQNQMGGPQQSVANNDADVSNQPRGSPVYENGQGSSAPPRAHENETQNADTNGDPDAPADTNDIADATNGTGESKDLAMQDGEEAVQIHGEHDSAGNHGATNRDWQPADDNKHSVGDASQFNEYGDSSQYGGGFGGRGGFYGGHGGRGSDVKELTPAAPPAAPPINAPTGPKAMRQGLPNTGWASRMSSQPKPTSTPAPELKSVASSARDDYKDSNGQYDDRGRSQSRSYSRRRSTKDDDGYESEETRARRKSRERRKRREERHEDEREERSSKKHRSRSESRTEEGSHRRHRDRDDDHKSSRSHRDKSKERRHRRHRSKSPTKDDGQDDHSRRKSKTNHERDSEYDDYKSSRRSRKHSRKDEDDHHGDDRKERSHRSSKHDRSTREDDRDRERERPRAVIEPPSDELGFKIKGSKSAKAHKESMAPPSSRGHDRRGSNQDSTIASSDPYAAERARAQQERETKEAQRRMSTQSSSLGKRSRSGEEEETFDAPRGPKGDRARVKKGRKERRIQYKYEDEVEGERWR